MKKRKQAINFVAFSVRVPEKTNEFLELEAEEKKRSKNEVVNQIIEKHYEKTELAKEAEV